MAWYGPVNVTSDYNPQTRRYEYTDTPSKRVKCPTCKDNPYERSFKHAAHGATHYCSTCCGRGWITENQLTELEHRRQSLFWR